MTKRVNKITRNYNNEPLKPGEVLVPTMYDAAFAKANCANPDCIKTITVAGRNFKVLYTAVPEAIAKAARSSFNLALNEQLGHYAVPNSVSIDQLADDYDLDPATVLSPEDMMIEQENKAETAAMFSDLVHHLIDRSPKHGLAALLLLNDVKEDNPFRDIIIKLSKNKNRIARADAVVKEALAYQHINYNPTLLSARLIKALDEEK